jgi:hypothetical protein
MDRVPLILTYSRALPDIGKILSSHQKIIKKSPQLRKIFKDQPLCSFRRDFDVLQFIFLLILITLPDLVFNSPLKLFSQMTHFRPHFPCSLDSGNGFFFNTFAVFWWTMISARFFSNLIEKQLLKVDELDRKETLKYRKKHKNKKMDRVPLILTCSRALPDIGKMIHMFTRWFFV